IRRPSRTRPIVASVMIPSPPTWIRSRITTWPNGDQYVPVSTEASPVTQTADVLVKSASTNGAPSRACDANGSISSAVPTAITDANEYAIRRSGCCARRRRRTASIGRSGAAMSTSTAREHSYADRLPPARRESGSRWVLPAAGVPLLGVVEREHREERLLGHLDDAELLHPLLAGLLLLDQL